MNFTDKLTRACRQNRSLLCVGLDPDPELMPGSTSVLDFNKAIIEATSDLVCAYKLNFAFYEALKDGGFQVLKQTLE
ncbi:MAG: orotidine 5'-phosphate decarboxylase, partial [Dehalococcoidales bacterium]